MAKGLRREPPGSALRQGSERGALGVALRDWGRDVGRGFMAQITNPKTLLYFSAVLPPFLDARRPLWSQLALIGAAALAIDAALLGAYGLGGAALAARLREPRNARLFSVVSGLLLLCAAALIALRL